MKKPLIFIVALFLWTTGNAAAQTKLIVADVREIILETGDGFCFDCERIITLRANNEPASFHGGKNSRVRKGDYNGAFAAADFTKLARAFVKNKFFNLKPLYEGATADAASVKITVVYKNNQKTVENFGKSDEPRFRKIERAFNAAADKIVWQPRGEKNDPVKLQP